MISVGAFAGPQIRLRDVFDRYDYNRNGRLEARELARLVRDLLPGATEADFNYLLVGCSAAVRNCFCFLASAAGLPGFCSTAAWQPAWDRPGLHGCSQYAARPAYLGCLRSIRMLCLVQAMLDYDGDVAVSYDELVAAVRECWAAGRAVSGRGEGGSIVEAVLGRVANFLRSQRVSSAMRAVACRISMLSEHRCCGGLMYDALGCSCHIQESARDVFYRFDRNSNGRLEARELARFLKAAMPELSPADVR